MSESNTLSERVNKVIADLMEMEGLEEDTKLDELQRVEMVVTLEEEFGTKVPDMDIETMDTPKEIAAYLCKRGI